MKVSPERIVGGSPMSFILCKGGLHHVAYGHLIEVDDLLVQSWEWNSAGCIPTGLAAANVVPSVDTQNAEYLGGALGALNKWASLKHSG